MLESVKRLLELQALDRRIRDLRAEARAVPESLLLKKDSVAVIDKRARQTEDAIKSARADAHRLETDMKGIEDKIGKLEIQMNDAKTNKELETFKHEITGLRADASVIEDKVLEALNGVDDLVRQRDGLKADLQTEEGELSVKEKDVEQAVGEIQKELTGIEGERGQHAEGMDPDLLSQYDRLIRSRDGSAVAAIHGGVCQGCFVNVRQQTINLVLQNGELVRCNNCGRIVYMEDEEAGKYRD